MEDVLKIRMTRALLEQLFVRDEHGNRLEVRIGEPDAEGFYSPSVWVTYSRPRYQASQEVSMTQQALNEADAARYIAMSASYLRRARSEGAPGGRTAGPQYVKLGRSVRYLVGDLDEWLVAHRQVVRRAESVGVDLAREGAGCDGRGT